ncbi:CDP-alcohol phosphatidyltransferase family protein [Pararobbsia silviterrae]|uniref:CDP-alcohol phosphatidyltransferase family protein n=1 Tax=Pararobbsia silviterrae TaxID=1792498 RepID=A0A494XEI1_9BURK|nr:CDP-alcohol phosphatidyltransferase family protein [Pararobbsia silviterrae]RKP46554.1 CDP-alcohol phosphatidyltransferase family protein [Pararobbsia silviterrae]
MKNLPDPLSSTAVAAAATARPWDARLARWLVTPLIDTRITPNHLTTLRLLIGVLCAIAFGVGGYRYANLGAALLVLSNFVDHTDGELARISGKTSRFGHFYDLACDALVTIALFVGIGVGVATMQGATHGAFALAGVTIAPQALGWLAGIAVALIFFLRMQIEEREGKAGTKQASVAGFETEDVLYLMPLVTLFDGTQGFLVAASIGAPLFALWVVWDYVRMLRRASSAQASGYEGAR